MSKSKNNGSGLEGLIMEVSGLMQQDTDGDIEYLRNKTTNEPDGGVDYIRSVKKGFDYFKYKDKLKDKKDVEE